jgi:Ni/Fe-hydrogenase subunit HybB-like protein
MTQVIWDISPQHPWGLPVVLAHFFSGISSGVIFIFVLHFVLNIKELKGLIFPAVIIALLLSIASLLILIMDLEQPFRAYMLFIYPNFSSPITWGTFLSVSYPLLLLIFLVFLHQKKGWWAVVCIIAGLTGMYPGFIIYGAMVKRYWCANIMPVYSILSAIVSGIALLLLYAICRKLRETFSMLKSSLCSGVIILIFITCVIAFSLDSASIFSKNFVLTVVAILCSLIIPFVVLLSPLANKYTFCLAAGTAIILIGVAVIKFLIYTGLLSKFV